MFQNNDNNDDSSSFISSIDGSIKESPINNFPGNGPISSAQNVNFSNTKLIDLSINTTIGAFQLESCRKISELLNNLGYSLIPIESADNTVYELKSFPRGERFVTESEEDLFVQQ
jgi:hypothetical protein